MKPRLLVTEVYSGTGWKTKKVPGAQVIISTGIGVFCDLQRYGTEEKILIQSSYSPLAPTPLHAESLGVLLASKIAENLKTHQVTFTDNLSLP
jgi:hypothetical protein